jgi:hypothetical protein
MFGPYLVTFSLFWALKLVCIVKGFLQGSTFFMNSDPSFTIRGTGSSAILTRCRWIAFRRKCFTNGPFLGKRQMPGSLDKKRRKKDSIYVPTLFNKRWHRLPSSELTAGKENLKILNPSASV